MSSGKQREYFHQKTQEAIRDLKQVSTIYRFQDPFFKQPITIAIPKVDKVDSVDTWLNNVSNILKTIQYLFKASALSTLEDHTQISDYFPIHGFCLDVMAAIIYKVADFITIKEDDKEMEMSTMTA
ncbi:hypothetical protein OQJ19_00455 [Fluoribacter gormanii]|uniref:hypothetical protein n=1 Tax=Fluoribacter gormanii TaxID=464 RepID=UPI002244C428|nr:hypothetical protein [Fluoribacter gormanii]MCW8443947.1 hypothetical protein [Fluoribacter gormanii]MCW8469129.1 hypothetical protein [Fluoribacter gormanii]